MCVYLWPVADRIILFYTVFHGIALLDCNRRYRKHERARGRDSCASLIITYFFLIIILPDAPPGFYSARAFRVRIEKCFCFVTTPVRFLFRRSAETIFSGENFELIYFPPPRDRIFCAFITFDSYRLNSVYRFFGRKREYVENRTRKNSNGKKQTINIFVFCFSLLGTKTPLTIHQLLHVYRNSLIFIDLNITRNS